MLLVQGPSSINQAHCWASELARTTKLQSTLHVSDELLTGDSSVHFDVSVQCCPRYCTNAARHMLGTRVDLPRAYAPCSCCCWLSRRQWPRRPLTGIKAAGWKRIVSGADCDQDATAVCPPWRSRRRHDVFCAVPHQPASCTAGGVKILPAASAPGSDASLAADRVPLLY